MSIKKITVFLSAILVFLNFLSAENEAENSYLIDSIVARINDQIITMSDLEKSIQLLPLLKEQKESEKDYFSRVLHQLINQKILSLEFAAEEQLTEEDLEKVQIKIINRTGSLENLKNLLNKWQMSWRDYLNFIKEYALFEKIIYQKIKTTLFVSFQEIESYYQENYLLHQKNLNLEPRPLTEMAALIENYLLLKKLATELQEVISRLRQKYEIEIYFMEK